MAFSSSSEKIFPKRPINRSARTWNRIIDNVNRPLETFSRFDDARPSSVVIVRNDTGLSLARGSVVGIYGLGLTDVDPYHLWFKADTIDLHGLLGHASRSYGVLLEPLPDGEFGRCQIAGACAALVTIASTPHWVARPVDGQTTFQSCFDSDGAVIMAKQTPGSTGVQLCAVHLGHAPPFRFGITNEAIAKDANGSIRAWLPNDYSAETETPFNHTARNWFRDVEANTRVGYVAKEGVLYIITGDCNPESYYYGY